MQPRERPPRPANRILQVGRRQQVIPRQPFLEQDAVMYPYIEAVRDLVASGSLAEAVNRALQQPGQVDA